MVARDQGTEEKKTILEETGKKFGTEQARAWEGFVC